MSQSTAKDRADRLADVLGDTLAHAANEALILARLEAFLDPKPAQLATSKEHATELNRSIDDLIRAYGGPPRLIFHAIDQPKPRYDTYLAAALDEVTRLFERSRNSLCRAKAFLIGMHFLETKPEVINLPADAPPEVRRFFHEGTSNAFWEHAEACYIRLAGYWDRVGQVLDFAFFGIRQYERDGFSAVLDRIRANTLHMYPEIGRLPAWEALWNYKKSEREDGLQWLLSRRNLLVHSLYLRPVDNDDDHELYESAFNHLDTRLRENLAVGSPEIEVNRLHTHLSAAATLLPQVIALCQNYAPHSNARSEV
jgi:hypothetical protein